MNLLVMKHLIPILALLALAGCGKDTPSGPSPTTSAPYSQTDLVVGTGTIAAAGNNHELIDHERRTCPAPLHQRFILALRQSIAGGQIVLPEELAARAIQAPQHARRA